MARDGGENREESGLGGFREEERARPLGAAIGVRPNHGACGAGAVHPYTATFAKQTTTTATMTSNVLEVDYASKNEFLALEKQVLTQYQLLAVKLNTLAEEIAKLNRHLPSGAQLALDPATGLADSLLRNVHNLERKVGLVYTLFRTAVYTLLLQNQESREPDVLDDFSAPLD